MPRRSNKRTVERAVLLGEFRRTVAVRTVDLLEANAGFDDGLLPSIVREVALMRSLATSCHPNIIELLGVEVRGTLVVIVTEFVQGSFYEWFTEPRIAHASIQRWVRRVTIHGA